MDQPKGDLHSVDLGQVFTNTNLLPGMNLNNTGLLPDLKVNVSFQQENPLVYFWKHSSFEAAKKALVNNIALQEPWAANRACIVQYKCWAVAPALVILQLKFS